MPESPVLLVGLIVVAIAFGVTNGFNDAANAIATVVGTRSLSPRKAVLMAAACDFAGAATGTAVAMTIGKGIVAAEYVNMTIVLAGVGAVIIWGVLATYGGMPVSLTHGLVAGLVGAGIAQAGSVAIVWHVLTRVMSAVAIAPILGFGGGFLVMVGIMWAFRHKAPDRVRLFFANAQILSAAFLAYSHGKNDGQMPIGVISMALMAYYGYSEFYIPVWAILVSATAISMGTAFGGWRVIQTLGLKMTTLRPAGGFAANLSAAAVIEVASHFGIPVSTTHCATSAIMGVGSTRRLSAVRWGIVRKIVLAWIVTFPACGLLGWGIAELLQVIF